MLHKWADTADNEDVEQEEDDAIGDFLDSGRVHQLESELSMADSIVQALQDQNTKLFQASRDGRSVLVTDVMDIVCKCETDVNINMNSLKRERL